MQGRGLRILSCSFRIWIVLVTVFSSPARAGECGTPSPDYQAERSVTVGDSTSRMKVYAAGALLREEVNTPRGVHVTIRDMRTGSTYRV